MSETANEDANIADSDEKKPVQVSDNEQFPPFPDPTDDDFDDDVPTEEREFYKSKFKDLNAVLSSKVHCSSCDRHLGCVPKNENRMRAHPMLRTLVCHTCHTFYNSGEFEKGDDGWELYCRWCGQGGQVYCCSSCRHVFCAKCIKRNLGTEKIKEIEDLDDWKCFKCNTKCLWDLRAMCWAVLRYCDLKNKISYKTEDLAKREMYLKQCTVDYSECCKSKIRRRERDSRRKEEKETIKKIAAASSIIAKIPPTIQVKKFASIPPDEIPKPEIKKATKRGASPKNKVNILKKPGMKPSNTYTIPPPVKKMRMSTPIMNAPMKVISEKNNFAMQNNSFIKIRPKVFPVVYNGINTSTFNNMFTNDNINLSLESLTQGLDMSSMSNATNNALDEEMVCTPDFPIEPLCEVTEDNTDDDVQCITPAPIAPPKPTSVVVKQTLKLSDISQDNIIQMTENDVTVNAATGGLKFRVDPQTLSSNKMYRLPDGRIFAINSNPNMPGGYSATIVAVTETHMPKATGATYAAKLNQITKVTPSTPPPLTKPTSATRILPSRQVNVRRNNVAQSKKTSKKKLSPSKEPDTNVPVEWYRYNLLDAIDALEYSLSRLNKLKKDATTTYLRSRNVSEMRTLHRSLESVLNTSTHRFKEIKENLNKELKQFIVKKNAEVQNSEDDDDVEILPNLDDDPIFIDENSLDSCDNETQEVDLTGPGSSEHNDSSENVQQICETEIITCDENNIGFEESPNNDTDNKAYESTDKSDETSSLNGEVSNNTSESNEQPDNIKQSMEENEDCELPLKNTNDSAEQDTPTIEQSVKEEEIRLSQENAKDSISESPNKASNETVAEEVLTEGLKDGTNSASLEIVPSDKVENIDDKCMSTNTEEENKTAESSDKAEENNVQNEEDDLMDGNDNYDISEKMIEDLLKDDLKSNNDSQSNSVMDIPDDILE